jgi:hypothetical protein
MRRPESPNDQRRRQFGIQSDDGRRDGDTAINMNAKPVRQQTAPVRSRNAFVYNSLSSSNATRFNRAIAVEREASSTTTIS